MKTLKIAARNFKKKLGYRKKENLLTNFIALINDKSFDKLEEKNMTCDENRANLVSIIKLMRFKIKICFHILKSKDNVNKIKLN